VLVVLPGVDQDVASVTGPALLAEMLEPLVSVTDCPAVRAMLPPEPASGEVPIDLLNMPPGEPSLNVPDIEMLFIAWIEMSPPGWVPLVPVSIWAPLPMANDPVVIETRPASPQGPAQRSLPRVCVKIPPGWMVPIPKIGSGAEEISPDIEIEFDLS
jgi:hypothetical protein